MPGRLGGLLVRLCPGKTVTPLRLREFWWRGCGDSGLSAGSRRPFRESPAPPGSVPALSLLSLGKASVDGHSPSGAAFVLALWVAPLPLLKVVSELVKKLGTLTAAVPLRPGAISPGPRCLVSGPTAPRPLGWLIVRDNSPGLRGRPGSRGSTPSRTSGRGFWKRR